MTKDLAPVPVTWDPADPAGLGLEDVLSLLRARCPWAAAHTHETLAPYLLEETYELLEAIEQHTEAPSEETQAELKKELGDVLYQVLFHAAVLDAPEPCEAPAGKQAAPRAFEEIQHVLKDKIVRRHPHVFESSGPWTLQAVEDMYERTKAAERGAAIRPDTVADDSEAAGNSSRGIGESAATAARASFDSLPRAMPALARAAAIVDRAERLGAPLAEPASSGTDQDKIGEGLLTLVKQARAQGIDPEQALRKSLEQAEAATLSQITARRG